MRNILVPCDFSKPAISAFRFAVELAARTNGKVHLLNLIQLPVMHDTVLMPTLNFEQQMLEDLERQVQSQFIKIIRKYPSDVKVLTKIEFGPIADGIMRYAEKSKIDLIVAGSHGTSGLSEYFIGSNAGRVIRFSTVPVLVLKDYYRGPLKNIVFPIAIDEMNTAVIEKVKELQQFFKAKLHIVWINTPVHFVPDMEAREKLKNFVRDNDIKNNTVSIYNHITPEQGIREFAKTVKADLIAMSTHGRTGFAHWLTGSLTESLANHSRVILWSYAEPKKKLKVTI
jgi:nucleotide-binding universal stress UspA family protein